MKTLFIDQNIGYDGTQLAPHWIFRNFDLIGDAVVAFIGEVNVTVDKMVDLVDVHHNEPIYSPMMLNFVVEHFSTDLELGIYRQRMFMVAIKEELEQYEIPVNRLGDDLYVNRGKLSVSIATSSVVSTLMHIGLNIETEGSPVRACGLKELGIRDLKSFAENVMLRYKRELEQIYEARCKVKGRAVEA
ncbi:MAG: DUF366 family protein [Syntrophomonadaceae bacterium]